MAREKKITLFSRNLVKIEKITGVDFEKRRESSRVISVNVSTTYEDNAPVAGKYEKGGWVKKKKISRLGFYYMSDYYNYSSYTGATTNKKGLTIKKITINVDTEQYILSYPIQYLDTKIGIEARPWDIAPNSKGMEDHFVDALAKEANKFFDIAFDNKITLTYKKKWFEKNNTDEHINVNQLKKETFIDLFGYEDGPRVQPNNVKLLAHGFDLKESFRKRKES
jgi:hypothetical protein